MKPKSASPTRNDVRYFKEVRFRQIRALVETAKHSSFAEASRQLGMSTPSVWRQVRALEDDYGVQLVTARGQDLRLTEDGERLVDLAEPLVEGFDSLKKVFADQHGKVQRNLRVVAPAAMLNGPLHQVIADYRVSHPQVRLSLMDAPSRQAWELLAADQADLAIVGAPHGKPLPARLEAVALMHRPFEVICQTGHPFAKIRSPKLRDILKQPLILTSEQSCSRIQFDHIVAKAGLSDQANVIMTTSNLTALFDYAAIGLGVSVLTRPTNEVPQCSNSKDQLLSLNVSHCLGQEKIVLLHQRHRHELAHVRAFREMVVKGLREKE